MLNQNMSPGKHNKTAEPGHTEIPVDTAKLQAALEKRADQETTVLPLT